MAQQHVLEVGDVVAVWPGENDSLFWLTICRDNVREGYDPESCDIQTFFLRFSGQRQRGHMVFVEENDEKVFGCISLESIICKSIELLLGDNAGQGFSFLLLPEEEARITDAIRVWEEQGEGDDETLNQVKVEPTELDTLPDSTALGAEDTQDAHNLLFSPPPTTTHQRQQQPEQKQTKQFTVNAIISERESEEGGREYLLDWAESWECKSNIFHRPKGHVKKTKARPEKALGKTGGDKVDGLGTINEEVVRILEVEPSGVGRCYKVKWRPTWTSELECPVTFILQWRIRQKQKQRVEVQEVKEEEEIEDDEDSEEEEAEVCGKRKVTVAKRSSMLTQAMSSADHTPVAQPSVIFQDDHFEDRLMEATAPEPSQAQSPRTDRAVPAGKTPATASTRPVLAGKTLAAARGATPPLTWREVIRLSLAELGQASVAQLDAHIQANFPEKRGRQNSKATIRQNLRRIGQLCHHQAGRNQEWRLRAAEEDEEEEEEEEEDEEDDVDVDKLRELYATSRRPSVEDLRNQFIRATSDEDLRKKQEALMELEGCLRHDLEGLTDLPLPCKAAAPPPPLPPVERRIVLVVWYHGIKYLAQYPRLSTADEVKTKTLRMAGHTEWINPIHYCLFLRPVCPEDTEREPTELADEVRLDEAYHNREFWLFEGFWPPAPWPHWPGW